MFLLLKIPTGLPQKAAKGDLWAQAAPRDHEPWLMTDGNDEKYPMFMGQSFQNGYVVPHLIGESL